jgi:hypothetical protein
LLAHSAGQITILMLVFLACGRGDRRPWFKSTYRRSTKAAKKYRGA